MTITRTQYVVHHERCMSSNKSLISCNSETRAPKMTLETNPHLAIQMRNCRHPYREGIRTRTNKHHGQAQEHLQLVLQHMQTRYGHIRSLQPVTRQNMLQHRTQHLLQRQRKDQRRDIGSRILSENSCMSRVCLIQHLVDTQPTSYRTSLSISVFTRSCADELLWTP